MKSCSMLKGLQRFRITICSTKYYTNFVAAILSQSRITLLTTNGKLNPSNTFVPPLDFENISAYQHQEERHEQTILTFSSLPSTLQIYLVSSKNGSETGPEFNLPGKSSILSNQGLIFDLSINTLHCLPNDTAAFESRPKCELPTTVAFLNLSLSFSIC